MWTENGALGQDAGDGIHDTDEQKQAQDHAEGQELPIQERRGQDVPRVGGADGERGAEDRAPDQDACAQAAVRGIDGILTFRCGVQVCVPPCVALLYGVGDCESRSEALAMPTALP